MIRYQTVCDCGARVEVVRDDKNPKKLYFECHNCGQSKELFTKEPIPDDPQDADSQFPEP